jgi:hypothetical protein
MGRIIQHRKFLKTAPRVNEKVSIIIPCYNQAHWLCDAIESALNQTYKNIEIIVVNDGSPDNTSEVVRHYPIILIEKENGGLSSARNAGIKKAIGDYILPLDSDDKISPLYIEKTIGKGNIVSTWGLEFGNSSAELNPIDNPTFDDFKIINRINYCSLYKKEVWEKVGGYDECDLMRHGCEDWDFWLRASKLGYNVFPVREVLFLYRKHGTSMINGAMSHYGEIKKYILGKHGIVIN